MALQRDGPEDAGGMPRFVRYLWIMMAAGIAAADYYSKKSVKEWLYGEGGTHEFTFFLSFTSVENAGIAFGMFAGMEIANFLTWFTVAFCAAIYAYMLFARGMTHRHAFVAALLLGGGIGNGMDRMRFGRVYDFIDLHLFGWHWPAFNVADVAISLAIVILVLMVFERPQEGEA